MRATPQPTEIAAYHDFGFAVNKKAAPRRLRPSTERFQALRSDRCLAFVLKKETNYRKSWAGIVAGSPTDSAPKKAGKEGSISASVASSTGAFSVPRTQTPVENYCGSTTSFP